MDLKLKAFQIVLVFLSVGYTSCQAEKKKSNKIVGNMCNDCGALLEYDPNTLTPIDTLPLFDKSEPKLKLTGIVFEIDGKTPAPNVIIYIYQTNREGVYELNGTEKGWAQRHGFIRGWVRTDQYGHYTFYTFRPASYGPEEHIHVILKETDKNPYTIDDFLFDDDPKLTTEVRKRWRNRGGSGIVKPIMENGLLSVNRDIILGLNIPNYE